MSVPKSRRKDASAQFIADARELRIKTMRMMKKFPSSYRYIFVNDILKLAAEIYVNCIRGNAVFMHKAMMPQDFEWRRKCLMIAYTSCDALNAEISFCYSVIMEGENIFKTSKERDDKFEAWTDIGMRTKERIRALLKSDRERYNGYLKK